MKNAGFIENSVQILTVNPGSDYGGPCSGSVLLHQLNYGQTSRKPWTVQKCSLISLPVHLLEVYFTVTQLNRP